MSERSDLKKWREARKLSPAEAAEACGISEVMWRKVEDETESAPPHLVTSLTEITTKLFQRIPGRD